LGRTSSRTLKVAEDSKGVEFSLDIPDTSLGRDLHVQVRRGDITGMSFGFISGDAVWPNTKRREVVEAELLEISVTPYPAYVQSVVEARAALATRDCSSFGTYDGAIVPELDYYATRLAEIRSSVTPRDDSERERAQQMIRLARQRHNIRA
jgi:hypothetical protein